MKIKDIDDLIKIVEVISQINIPGYIISINSDAIIKTLEEVKLILPDVVVPKGTLCECGGNERVALDYTMKPCKHPKYFKG